jgi:hypothetical protein
MYWSPIGTRLTALIWIGVWKGLDFWTTKTLIPLQSTSELNPLINYLTPIIGLESSLFLTVILALGATYGLYFHIPVVVEVLAIYLPLAVIGNFMVFISPLLNQIMVLFTLSSFIGYVIYLELTKRNHGYSFNQSRLLYTSSVPE